MAAQNSNKNDNHTGFSINVIKNICSKYKKYIATGAMLILLAVVVSTSSKASQNQNEETIDPPVTKADTETDDQEKVQVNAYPQINGLFEEYYKYYAAGDTESIAKIAFPISDTEKSYIQCFSKCMDSYEDINCYTKPGIAEGEYVVTVLTDMKFKDVETAAPNLDSFYVRRDEKGNSYIDNAYSSFNETNKENERDEKINTLISEFGQDEDVIQLTRDVQGEYDEALEKDEALKEMVLTTVPDVLSEWVATFSPQTSADDENGDAKDKDTEQTDNSDENQDNEADNPDQSDNQTSGQDENTAVKTRTAYAKTKVNMRKKPSTDSKILQTLNAGTKVTLYGKSQDGWFKAKCKGKTGYISKEYIVSDPSKVQVQKRTAYAKTRVNMRKQRSTDSDVVQALRAGTKVMIYGNSKNGWFRVRSKGKFGYVKKEYIVSSKSKVEKETGSQNPTTSSPTYLNEGDRITLTESVNIRTSMSETADRVGLAYQGDVVTIIMSYAEGWSKVSWNGQTGYAKTEFLR